MSSTFADLPELAQHLRAQLNTRKFVLLYAYNGTGKTRLSTAFKDIGKTVDTNGEVTARDTLYFNAFTEDLFQWDNDLANDRERVLKINRDSSFFAGLEALEMDNRIRPLLNRYADFEFEIDAEAWEVTFAREVRVAKSDGTFETRREEDIKISRGEENIFIWCFFLAIVHFEIHHGDTLANDWDWLRETNPARKPAFDAVVANPPFSYRWDPKEATSQDPRFKNHGVAPKSAADFAFLLHGLHYLKDDGVMAIILPHGVLFRGGKEAAIRRKLLDDGHIDTVIGLPANLFYSTGIPVCILVLKKCKKPDDVLFINAASEENFTKGKRQNQLDQKHIERIVSTYRERSEQDRYSRRVPMEEIASEKNDYNLNISRYVSTAEQEVEIDLAQVHAQLREIECEIQTAKARHNAFLGELGLARLP